MRVGAIIEKGPMDWQILQQNKGKADMIISGTWTLPEGLNGGKVFVRIMGESSGDVVIPWTGCIPLQGNGWEVTLKDVPAGGLYRIETTVEYEGMPYSSVEFGYRGDMRHHIGVGDIYVIAGQSNAAGYGKGPFFDPPEIGVHLFKNNGTWDLASHPMNDSTDTTHSVNMEIYNPGHSPYLHFAKVLKKELGYPIGLLQTALGGSPLSRWNPSEEGDLYRNMVECIRSTGGNIKGILWDQGSSDALNPNSAVAESYGDRFIDMVECLRRDLENPDLSVFTVQFNRYLERHNETMDIKWGKVKEAQRQVPKKMKHVYVTPSSDCMLSDCVHNGPAGNLVIGERLAKIALTMLYNKSYMCMAPDINAAVKLSADAIELRFDNVYGALYANDLYSNELPFTIIDERGTLGLVAYETTRNGTMLLIMERAIEGKAVIHCAYEQYPVHPVPVDRGSFLPMLSFYGVDIT